MKPNASADVDTMHSQELRKSKLGGRGLLSWAALLFISLHRHARACVEPSPCRDLGDPQEDWWVQKAHAGSAEATTRAHTYGRAAGVAAGAPARQHCCCR